eukprot:scaffold3343_cov99-Skeletonema_marinoi.AAC.5
MSLTPASSANFEELIHGPYSRCTTDTYVCRVLPESHFDRASMDGDGDGEASRYLQLARTRIDFGGRKSYVEAPRISLKLRKNR